MPLQATSGAASQDAFGGNGVAVVPNYIEDVFSTWLYTGTGASQTITNGIDLSTKGGLVWIKGRNTTALHGLVDTVRGVNSCLVSSSAAGPNDLASSGISSFSSTGFVLNTSADFNGNTNTQASWTFRKQTKFFDVVTYTGNATSGRTVNHNLGSIPACIIVKNLSRSTAWSVYHRGINGGVNPQNYYLLLNTTDAQATASSEWNNTAPTSTEFTIGNGSNVNNSAENYVAYLFAHNAGGFGLTGTDNVISCGSFTTDGSGNATVNLGYEPQWVILKPTNAAIGWSILDTMRGWSVTTDAELRANTSSAENTPTTYGAPNATGFSIDNNALGSSNTVIYIAIRRGPMKVPTTGTSVFAPLIIPINSASATVPINAGLTTDLVFGSHNSDESGGKYFASRLTADNRLNSTSTAAEAVGAYYWDNMVGVRQQETNAQPTWYFLKRAPSFMDVVCYTGTGSTSQTVNHNLGVTPELIIYKRRNAVENWPVAASAVGFTKQSNLNLTDDFFTNYDLTATSSTLLAVAGANTNTGTYVAYLFATCAGVSKVFSYTGNGSSQTINCGFTAGARFVLIKRTNSTGDWYVWDTARGIVAGNDPHLSLNTTTAEVTTDDTIDTDNTGFVVNQVTATNVNVSSATYIGLAVA